MKVFYHNQFTGFWLTGTAVVMAETAEEAAGKLAKALKENGLEQPVDIDLMVELLPEDGAVILFNGDY